MQLIDLKVLLELVKKNAPFIYSILLPIAKLCPTIEAEPVRHGEWIEYFMYGCWHYDCPFCDDGYATEERQKVKANYCSNCGAKMDGGQ